MYRIYITLIEIMAAAVFIIPLWMLYHKTRLVSFYQLYGENSEM